MNSFKVKVIEKDNAFGFILPKKIVKKIDIKKGDTIVIDINR